MTLKKTIFLFFLTLFFLTLSLLGGTNIKFAYAGCQGNGGGSWGCMFCGVGSCDLWPRGSQTEALDIYETGANCTLYDGSQGCSYGFQDWMCSTVVEAENKCGGGGGAIDNPPECGGVAIVGQIGDPNNPSPLNLQSPSVSSNDHAQCGTKDEGDNGIAACQSTGNCLLSCMASSGGQDNDPFVSGDGAFQVSFPDPISAHLSVSPKQNSYKAPKEACGGGCPALCLAPMENPFHLCLSGTCACDDDPPAGYGCRKCNPNIADWISHQVQGPFSGDLPNGQSEGNYDPPSKTLSYSIPGSWNLNGRPLDYIIFDVKDNNLGQTGKATVCAGACTIVQPGANGTEYYITTQGGISSFQITISYSNNSPENTGFTVYNVRPGWNSLYPNSCPIAGSNPYVAVFATDDKGWKSNGSIQFSLNAAGNWQDGVPNSVTPSSRRLVQVPFSFSSPDQLSTRVLDLKNQAGNCPPAEACPGPKIDIGGVTFQDDNRTCDPSGQSRIGATVDLLGSGGWIPQSFTTNLANNYSYLFSSVPLGGTIYSYNLTPTVGTYASTICCGPGPTFTPFSCGSSINSYLISPASTINIAFTNNVPWFNAFDGDVYGLSILDKIPPVAANNYMINNVASIGNAGGVGIAQGSIRTTQSFPPNRTSTRGNPPAPGWEATGNSLAYFSTLPTMPTTFSGSPLTLNGFILTWPLAANKSYELLSSSASINGPGTAVIYTLPASGGIATVFHQGDLRIEDNLTTGLSSDSDRGLVLIVYGDVTIDQAVTEIDAVIISTGTITIAGSDPNPLVVRGGLYAQNDLAGSNFSRTLTGTQNLTLPAISVYFNPVQLTNTNADLITSRYTWEELTPQ